MNYLFSNCMQSTIFQRISTLLAISQTKISIKRPTFFENIIFECTSPYIKEFSFFKIKCFKICQNQMMNNNLWFCWRRTWIKVSSSVGVSLISIVSHRCRRFRCTGVSLPLGSPTGGLGVCNNLELLIIDNN